MSTTKRVTVWCDQRGCPIHLEVGAATDRKARDLAYEQGWRNPDSRKDYCPRHAAKPRSGGHRMITTEGQRGAAAVTIASRAPPGMA